MNNRTVGVALTADPSGLQAGLSSATSAAQDFAARTTASMGRVSAASASMQAAAGGVSKGIDGVTLAERAHTAAAQRFVADLQRQAAAIGKTRAELLEMQAAQLGVSGQAAPMIAALRQAENALGSGTAQFNKYGLSAKQTEAALRGVPAQLTDIFVSLQGGQRPMTVLLQQGGQLKDMFGGIVPAAQALASTALKMVNPLTLAAGAAVAMYAAYRQGASEYEAFNETVIVTGNVAGVTAGRLSEMSARVGDVVGTQHQAAAALNALAGSGRISAESFEQFAAAAMAWEQATGAAVDDTVKKFEELGKAPVEASLKLNESMNYLTASTYQQINALESAGRHTEAAALAQNTYADAITKRSPEIVENLSLWQRMWKLMKEDIQEVSSLVGNIGRAATPQSRLADLQSEYDQIADSPAHAERAAAIQAQIVGLRDLIKWQDAVAQNRAAEGRKVAEVAAAEKEWSRLIEQSKSRVQQRDEEIASAKKWAEQVGASEQELATVIDGIRKKYQDKSTGGISTTQTELARLNGLIEAEKQREAALHSLGAAQGDLNEGEKLAIQYGEKLKLVTNNKTRAELERNKALAEQYGAMKRANDQYDKDTKERQSAIDSVRKQTSALEDQIDTYGMGKSAIEAMTIARLEEKLAIDSSLTKDERHLELLRQEIEERQKLLGAMRTKEALDAQLKEWQNWEREVDRIFDQLGQSLTDQLFEGGKSARDMLKDLFKNLVLRVAIQPILSGLQGMVTNQIGGLLGYQDPRQQSGGGLLGMAQNASSALSALTGGPSSMFGNAAQWLGKQVGSEALSAFGMGMSGAGGIAAIGTGVGASLGTTIGTSAAAMTSTTFSAALGGTAGVASGSGVVGSVVGGGAAGLGSAIGAALPYVGIGLAAASAFGLFDSGPPKTRHGQRTTIDYAGGAYGISAIDDRQAAGSEQAALAAAQSAVAAANDLFARIGVNAGIESFYAVMESSVLGDRNGVASGGTLRIGDELRQIGVAQASDMTLGGFGGWSSAEMLPRLQTDIQLSILEAFQSLGSQLPSVLSSMLEGVDLRNVSAETAQDLATRFAAVADGATQFLAAIEAMPFEQLRGLSFDAAAGLVQLAGGVEGLLSAQQAYYQAYYSEAERHGIAVNNLTSALAAAGVVMPELVGSTDQMLASYRAIVEAQDLNTEAGRQVYVALMQASGAFAEVAQYAGQAAAEVGNAGRTLADVTRERLGLEGQLLQLQGNTAEIRRRELEALDESNHALQRYIWSLQDQQSAFDAAVAVGESAFSALSRSVSAEKSRLQKESQAIADALRNSISAASNTVNELTSLTGRLTSTVQRMIGQGLDEGRNRAWAQDRIDRALSVAKLTGVMPQGADFESALSIVAEPSEGLFSSFEDYQADFLKTAHTISSLNELADSQLSTEKRALNALEDQLKNSQQWYQEEMERLDQLLEMERQRLDIAMGTYQTLLTIPEALAGITAAIGNIKLVMPPAAGGGAGAGGGGGYTPVPGSDIGSSSWTTDYLLANPDVLTAYDTSWGLSPEAWAQYHYDTYGRNEGRSYDVGTSFVPNDMLANIHRGEIIIDPRSSDILRRYGIGVQGGGGQDMAAMRREMEQMRRAYEASQRLLQEIADSSRRSAEGTRRLADGEAQIPVHVQNPVGTVLLEDRTA